MRAATFLDRDGVLNELVVDPRSGLAESPLEVEDVRLIPGAAAAAGRLTQAGYALVCVSNQPAAAKGRVSLAQLCAVHSRVTDLLAEEGVVLDASRLCVHHAHGVVPELLKALRVSQARPRDALGCSQGSRPGPVQFVDGRRHRRRCFRRKSCRVPDFADPSSGQRSQAFARDSARCACGQSRRWRQEAGTRMI